jgi:hypothetical protein
MHFKFKNMKKIITTLFLFTTTLLLAQPGDERGNRREKMEAMKIGFMTKRLNLTPEEAKTFWPVYNQYQNEIDQLRKKRKEERPHDKEALEALPDKAVEKLVDEEIALRQGELDIVKKYHAQFKQVLPIKKVAQLYRTEEDFKRELLKKIQERREEKP